MFKMLNKVVMLDSIVNVLGVDYVKVTDDRANSLVSADDFDVSSEILDTLKNDGSYSAVLSLGSDKIHAEILTEWF